MRFKTFAFEDLEIDPFINLDDDPNTNNLFDMPPNNATEVQAPVQAPANRPSDRETFRVVNIGNYRNRNTDNLTKHLITAIKALEKRLGNIEF
jgi:hypothetical protein